MERYLEFILNHYLLSLGLAVTTFLLIQELVESALRKYELISPNLVVAKMNAADTTLLDVRDEPEFITGHIDTALNIPLSKLEEKLSEAKLAKDKPLIVACQTGNHSASACKILTKNGFSQVFALAGGMRSWEENKLPVKVTSKNKS